MTADPVVRLQVDDHEASGASRWPNFQGERRPTSHELSAAAEGTVLPPIQVTAVEPDPLPTTTEGTKTYENTSGENPITPSPAPSSAPSGGYEDRPASRLAAQPLAPLAAQPNLRVHTVVDGDSLSQLAVDYLGRADRHLEIYELNRHRLGSVNYLPMGTKLIIPPREPAPQAGRSILQGS